MNNREAHFYLEELQRMMTQHRGIFSKEFVCANGMAIQALEQERKKGKWKMNKDGNWACPFCEFDPYHDNMKGMNYCPNCGARMEETDERT